MNLKDVQVIIHPEGWVTIVAIATLIFFAGVVRGILMAKKTMAEYKNQTTFDFENNKL